MFYQLLRILVLLPVKLLYGVEFQGAEHIPGKGPVVISANHSSYLDWLLIPLGIPRKVRYMVYYEYFQNPLFRLLMKAYRCFPVYQRGGMDKGAFEAAVRLLRQGEVVGIFPEGSLSRNGRLQKGRPGAARIAASVGAPVVPVSIIGAFPIFPKGRSFPRCSGKIRVIYHPPIPTDPARRRDKVYLEQLTEQVMHTIQSGLPEAMWPKESGELKAEGAR